jgi:hypothetical protein
MNTYWCPNCKMLYADAASCALCNSPVKPVALGVGPDSNVLKVFRSEVFRSEKVAN